MAAIRSFVCSFSEHERSVIILPCFFLLDGRYFPASVGSHVPVCGHIHAVCIARSDVHAVPLPRAHKSGYFGICSVVSCLSLLFFFSAGYM